HRPSLAGLVAFVAFYFNCRKSRPGTGSDPKINGLTRQQLLRCPVEQLNNHYSQKTLTRGRP
ncbi:hypothetical protein, partial [Endozoicomonas sp. YOMI1]|uniref:hypothetical protein n=1 Tax=Endozoicomonas sp. YOMI1 TaxID=2828739 RepID=UPI0021498D78